VPALTRLVPLMTVISLCAAACNADEAASPDDDSDPVASEADLFDSTVVHEIEVSFDGADYDAMIETFADTDEKEWIEATVTIDGTTYEQAGLRLKGNSSLAGLGGGFGARPGGDVADGEAPATTTTENAADATDATTTTDDGNAATGPGRAEGFGSASADEAERLPWLIRLDQFVDGQDHQGYEDIVVRSNGSETSLNEAVALDLLEEAGLASQEAAATSFTVNGGDPILRLAIEHPDDDAWQEDSFDSEGALYKAESSGDWSYRGDDPAAYEEVFDQEGGSDVTDLTPLIDFLQFINESDDATFAAELSTHLDVDAFATYLAMMEIVENFDDIDGPGNNAYLWYDVDSGQMTVVPWDMNLAFGVMGGGQGGAAPGGSRPEGPDPEQLPEGFDPGELPEGFDPGQGPGGGGFGGRSNILVERFHATPELESLYQEKLTTLRASLYEDGGTADGILAVWEETLQTGANDLVDEQTIADEVDAIERQLTTE